MKQLVGKLIARFVFALLVFAAGSVWAVETGYWNGKGSDTLYSTAANWKNNYVPRSGDQVRFRAADVGNAIGNMTVTMRDVYTNFYMHVGSGSSAENPFVFTADLDPSHGLTLTDDCWLGYFEAGWLWLKSGTYTFAKSLRAGIDVHSDGSYRSDKYPFWLKVGDGESEVTLNVKGTYGPIFGSSSVLVADKATLDFAGKDLKMYSSSGAFITNSTMNVNAVYMNGSSTMTMSDTAITINAVYMNDLSTITASDTAMTINAVYMNDLSTITASDTVMTISDDFNVANDTGANCSFLGSSATINMTANNRVLNVGFGQGSTGVVEKAGGDWTCYYLRIGKGSGSKGEFTQNGGALTVLTELSLGNGANSTGRFVLNGGTVTAAAEFNIGNSAGANPAYFEVSRGTVNSTKLDGCYAIVGYRSEGTLVLKDGSTFNVSGIPVVGHGSTGTLVVKDGSRLLANSNKMYVGECAASSGTLTVKDGGVVEVKNNDVILCHWEEGSCGLVNLEGGGELVAKKVCRGKTGGTAELAFNGGTLKATTSGVNLIDSNIAVTVGENGGTIDTDGKAVSIVSGVSGTGGMTFRGGDIVTLGAGCSYTGGTAIELGTKVVDSTEEAQAKAAILDHGLLVDGRARLSATDYTVFECSGGLTDADIANVTFTNCYEGTAAKVVDGTKLVVTLVAPPCVNTSNSIKVFSGMTLGDIAYAKFSSRFCGSYVGEAFDAIDSAKGYNKRLNKDGNGNLTSIVVEFQILDGKYTKCVVVEFTDDGTDIYAKALGARYVENQPISHPFYDGKSFDGVENLVATSPDAAGYGVCDIRVTVDEAMLWTLDQDRSWSELRNGATLSPDSAVRILVTGDSPVLTIDENVDVAKIEFINGGAGGVSTNSIAVSDGVTVTYGAIELDANVCLLSDGFDAAFVALSSTSTLLYSSGETVFNSTVSGSGVVEVVPNATLYVDGNVAASIRFLNNGTVVKRIAEVVSVPFYNGSTGVTIVSNGTLKAANYAGSGSSHVVRVVSGATFDMNGIMDVNVIVRLEEGASFVNTDSSIGNGKSQAVRLILDGDAAATASKDFGLLNRNYASTSLDLGSHTLALDGTGKFWLVNTTIVGSGTIAVENGSLHCSQRNSSGEDCTVNIGSSGVLRIDGTKTLSVKNFFNGGRIGGGDLAGGTNYGTLQVTGTLTTGNALTNLTLEAGATVKMTGTAQIVSGTFSASGTIAVDASEISASDLRNATDGRIPVLTVPTAQVPVGVSWVVTNDPLFRSRLRWVQNGDGTSTLYLCKYTGLVLILK